MRCDIVTSFCSCQQLTGAREAAAIEPDPVHERGPTNEPSEALASPTTKERAGGVDFGLVQNNRRSSSRRSTVKENGSTTSTSTFYKKYEENPTEKQTYLGEIQY